METREQLQDRIARLAKGEREFKAKASRARLTGRERAMRKNAVIAGNFYMVRLQVEDKLREQLRELA